ncbi:hypothetical protein L484_020604 [Morus notabilis]|uniref:Uncharacterized protein n=1 Tax=Morus notabilis TaxID=981085 RepID=W9SJI0_9ROSA|nr:hypothetical protein L484_020604 [Morus notabilis]
MAASTRGWILWRRVRWRFYDRHQTSKDLDGDDVTYWRSPSSLVTSVQGQICGSSVAGDKESERSDTIKTPKF